MSRGIVEKAQNLFEKSFSFELRDIALPPTESLFNSEPWNVLELMEMKEDLNKIKCLLDNEDIIEWRRHTKYTNYAAKILSEVRFAAQPEMLTQAWLKFYEIVSRYPIVPKTSEHFYTFHLCEAPGAFIAALNHYLVLKRKKKKWLWMANTLNPYYEGNSSRSAIMDDQFIIDTFKNWIFGSDNKGDIMDPMYLEDLRNKVDGEMQLVTADGSFDCQGNPTEQEKTVSSLHYCEIVIALHLLNEGGCFVIKMFTMFESESLCNMFLLNSVFEEVNVFKPATSKSGNSEVYVVCIKFKGREKMEPSFLKVLRQHMGQNLNQMFPKEFIYKNETFIAQMLECTQQFKDYQKETILQNLKLKKGYMTEDQIYFLQKMKKECAKLYLKSYNLRKIEPEEFLSNSKISQVVNFNPANMEMHTLETKLKGGSLKQRRDRKDKGSTAQITFLKECLSTLQKRTDSLTVLKKEPSKFNGCEKYQIIKGRPYKCILNSKFCFPSITEIWNEVIHYQQIMPLSYCESDWNWCHLQNKKNDIFSNLQNRTVFYTSGGKNMPELKGLINNLNYNGKVTSIYENTQCNDKKLIFIGIPISDILYNEMNMQKTLINRIREMMKVLKEDDSLVLSLHGVLSRFAAGIIYFLCELFSEASVINPEENSSLLANQIWIFSCANIKYLGKIKNHLDQVANQMEECDGTKAVLEIISIRLLCEDWFYSYLLNNNEAFVTRKIRRVLDSF